VRGKSDDRRPTFASELLGNKDGAEESPDSLEQGLGRKARRATAGGPNRKNSDTGPESTGPESNRDEFLPKPQGMEGE